MMVSVEMFRIMRLFVAWAFFSSVSSFPRRSCSSRCPTHRDQQAIRLEAFPAEDCISELLKKVPEGGKTLKQISSDVTALLSRQVTSMSSNPANQAINRDSLSDYYDYSVSTDIPTQNIIEITLTTNQIVAASVGVVVFLVALAFPKQSMGSSGQSANKRDITSAPKLSKSNFSGTAQPPTTTSSTPSPSPSSTPTPAVMMQYNGNESQPTIPPSYIKDSKVASWKTLQDGEELKTSTKKASDGMDWSPYGILSYICKTLRKIGE